ncbi:MAG: hypothetical protein JWO35_694 [Candidatus Saccharibacteria bacterium]|nr:hypothetical protein [Candidatus Saccharibacteria bacterium]
MGSRTPNTTSSTRTFMSSKPPAGEPKAPRKRPQIKLPKKFSPWLLVIALLVFSIFMFVQYRQAKDKIAADAPAAASQQVDDVITKVGKLIILPKDQKPTVATVVHADKLKDQTFFANAKDGDKVLVYSTQKQAILYRPSTNQLVNVSSVTVTPTGNTSLSPQ